SDTKLLQRLFPSSAWVLADRAFLQDNHFSIFSDSYYRALNRKADSLYRRAPASDCAGSLQTTEVLGGPSPGYGASGWAWSVKERRAAERILLVIEDGTVIGFGVGLEPHAKLAQIIPFMKAASVGWLGDLQRPNHRVHVTAYAL